MSSCSGSSSWDLSSSSKFDAELSQFNPWQFSHAGIHHIPYFRQEHQLVLQLGLAELTWQLHEINCSIDSGAVGWIKPTGSNVSVKVQPYSVGFNDWLSNRSQSRYWR